MSSGLLQALALLLDVLAGPSGPDGTSPPLSTVIDGYGLDRGAAVTSRRHEEKLSNFLTVI